MSEPSRAAAPATGGSRQPAGACPCGSGQGYADCCGPYLSGAAQPPTALALMRSRYTAYARRDAAYLLASWHPDTRPAALDFSHDATEWAGLAIVRQEAGAAGDAEGVVEFVAACRQGGMTRRLRESSRFVKEAGVWLYWDGILAPDVPAAKPGRNDPCPCGSGQKYKKCCG